ncbi:MAG: hypothetical protein ACP5RH_09345 [Leptodesmis sp.]|uniref:hypothetical protein n=1 Tax=Leptodesmis sp. TaxID=3100501 RepID=UPI003D0E084C
MTNEANNIVKQAKQGSVAAIIQVLNEKLADSGVRTRAIFADGVLQLLCEGATLDQLEQIPLVERIRQILETIAPRNIRRVKINSRIVREQQLLWLEEINRDPEHQLLWSEEIVLKKPGFFKQLSEDWSARSSEVSTSKSAPPPPRKQREQRQFWRGLIGGVIASCLLLAGGWWLYNRFGSSEMATQKQENSAPKQTGVPSATTSTTVADPFAEAVRLAERTSASGRSAKSSADWLGLASQWQQASDLMAAVPASDARYKTAQSRVTDYRRNSEISLAKAKELQTAPSPEAAPTQPATQ